MTAQELVNFLNKNNTPAPITYGDFKKLSILENLALCRATNIVCDLETIAIYTGLTEQDLQPTLNKLIMEGVIIEKEHDFAGKFLSLNLTETNNEELITGATV